VAEFHKDDYAIDGVLGLNDATEQKPNCLQGNPDLPLKTVGDEDCLYVNVFTKHPGEADAKRQVCQFETFYLDLIMLKFV